MSFDVPKEDNFLGPLKNIKNICVVVVELAWSHVSWPGRNNHPIILNTSYNSFKQSVVKKILLYEKTNQENVVHWPNWMCNGAQGKHYV